MSIMDCIQALARSCLLVLSCVVSFVGLTLMLAGVFMSWELYSYNSFLPSDYSVDVPSKLLIAVGVLIIVISMFVCWNSGCNSRWLMFSLAVMMAAILLLELTAATMAFIYKQRLVYDLEASMLKRLKRVSWPGVIGERAMESWNEIQNSLECCGVGSFDDWQFVLSMPVPTSCSCSPSKDVYFCQQVSGVYIYGRGCNLELQNFVNGYLYVLGVIGFTIVAIQSVAFVIGLLVYRRRRSNYVPLE